MTIKNRLNNLSKYVPLVRELIKRDLKVKYRRSFLGYMWSLLNPLLMMAVMTVIFSFMFKSSIENFPLYLICGNVLFGFFNESTNMAMYSVLQNGTLIKKVYIPKYIFPISRVLSCFVTMSFSLVAIVIVLLVTRSPLYWQILLFPIPLLFLLLFSTGMGMILSTLAVYFRDITHLYGIVTMVWMYATPIFYPLDPQMFPPEVITLVQANPLTGILTFFRSLVLYGQVPEIGLWISCTVSCLVVLAVGMLVFKKFQKNFILYL